MITKEQAIAELKRREAITELSKRGIDPNQAIGTLASSPPPYYSNPRTSEELFQKQRYDNIQRDTRNALISQGMDDAQINIATQLTRKLQSPPSKIGQLGGAIAGELGGVLAVNLIPGMAAHPVDELVTVPRALYKIGKTAIPMITAGLGGVGGKALQVHTEEGRAATRKELLNAFLEEFGAEVVMHGTVRAGKVGLAPFTKKPIDNAKEIVKRFQKVGSLPSPSQVDKSLELALIDEVTQGSFGSKELAKEMLKRNVKAGDLVADGILDEMVEGVLRTSKTELADRLSGLVTRPRGELTAMLDDIFKPAYKELFGAQEAYWKKKYGYVPIKSKILGASGEPITTMQRGIIGRELVAKLSPEMGELETFLPRGVSTKKLKKFALEQLQKEKRVFPGGVIPKGKKFALPSSLRNEYESILAIDKHIHYEDMFRKRSTLLRELRKAGRDWDPDELALKKLEQITFDSLTDPSLVRGSTPKNVRLFNNLRGLWAKSREGLDKTFNAKRLQRVVDNPSRLLSSVIPEGSPRAIKELKESLLEPVSGFKSPSGEALWKQLRTAWYADLMDNVIDPDAGTVHAGKYYRKMRRMGEKALDEMFYDVDGKKGKALMDSLVETLSRKPSSGGASLFIRGMQLSGGYLLYKGLKDGDYVQVGKGGAIMAGPYFIAKMALHPIGNALLRSGVRLKPGSTELVPIVYRMIKISEEVDAQNEKVRKMQEIQKLFPPLPSPPSGYYRGFGGRGV
jgi:hypothetical protein